MKMNEPPVELSKSMSSAGGSSKLIILESIFRVVIACYCGHLIGRAYASGYDDALMSAGTPEFAQTLRVPLRILPPMAIMLGYYTSVKLTTFLEYRWGILLSTCVLYTGILTQRGYFGTGAEYFVGGLGLASFGSGMSLLPSYSYRY